MPLLQHSTTLVWHDRIMFLVQMTSTIVGDHLCVAEEGEEDGSWRQCLAIGEPRRETIGVGIEKVSNISDSKIIK